MQQKEHEDAEEARLSGENEARCDEENRINTNESVQAFAILHTTTHKRGHDYTCASISYMEAMENQT